jgi:hypothetical protein
MTVLTSENMGGRTMSNDNEPTIPAPHHVWSERDERGGAVLLYAEGDPIPESRAVELGLIKAPRAAAKVQEPGESKVAEPGQAKSRAPRKRAAAKPKE